MPYRNGGLLLLRSSSDTIRGAPLGEERGERRGYQIRADEVTEKRAVGGGAERTPYLHKRHLRWAPGSRSWRGSPPFLCDPCKLQMKNVRTGAALSGEWESSSPRIGGLTESEDPPVALDAADDPLVEVESGVPHQRAVAKNPQNHRRQPLKQAPRIRESVPSQRKRKQQRWRESRAMRDVAPPPRRRWVAEIVFILRCSPEFLRRGPPAAVAARVLCAPRSAAGRALFYGRRA